MADVQIITIKRANKAVLTGMTLLEGELALERDTLKLYIGTSSGKTCINPDIPAPTKADLNLENVDNTSDVSKPISNATQAALNAKANAVHNHGISDINGLGTAASKNTGTAAGNIPVLDASGKLATAVMPPAAITEVYVVASQAAMLGLTAETGDVAVRTDLSRSYILKSEPASALANWQELLIPTQITKNDIGLGSVDNTADKDKNVATAAKWTNPRKLSATGDITGNVSMDGSQDVSMALTLANSGAAAGSYGETANKAAAFGGTILVPQVTVDAKGRITAIAVRTITLPAAPTNISGNAGTATKLATPRILSLTGDVTGSGSFDGSNNLSIAATISKIDGGAF